ncbi:beta-ketoacyl synthase chain length factor [Chitinophaga pendula]|uniref:beta-ketoacyl synthase chain length factor n=1 Tax=Chitinophaga TaxID=79328 RepID=UPI0012FDD739|nr:MULTISPECIES: beta-ketoacyl synthase chain length factor [Chitinophaga]UCJ07778.1 beta-ketoacyl synthase chain length factor [Chitinophaga pendula]
MAAITPQNSFEGEIFQQPMLTATTTMLQCVEPDYKTFIPGNSLRRMSRLLKMGLTTAIKCLQDANTGIPEAIVTGTGKGSLQDTERFLHDIRTYNEQALNPTPFIQSTYNAINGLIALQQQCTTYNNTFVHRGLSFESALLDSIMLLNDGVTQILTGAFDEITAEHKFIKGRIRHWREHPVRTSNLYDNPAPGTIAGEGTAFFSLANTASPSSYAAITGIRMMNWPPADRLGTLLTDFLAQHQLTVPQLDLVITGRCGDSNHEHYYAAMDQVLHNTCQLPFKHLTGEYETAGAIALWLAAHMLRAQKVPAAWFPMARQMPAALNHVLIYNHHFGEQHAFILLERIKN